MVNAGPINWLKLEIKNNDVCRTVTTEVCSYVEPSPVSSELTEYLFTLPMNV